MAIDEKEYLRLQRENQKLKTSLAKSYETNESAVKFLNDIRGLGFKNIGDIKRTISKSKEEDMKPEELERILESKLKPLIDKQEHLEANLLDLHDKNTKVLDTTSKKETVKSLSNLEKTDDTKYFLTYMNDENLSSEQKQSILDQAYNYIKEREESDNPPTFAEAVKEINDHYKESYGHLLKVEDTETEKGSPESAKKNLEEKGIPNTESASKAKEAKMDKSEVLSKSYEEITDEEYDQLSKEEQDQLDHEEALKRLDNRSGSGAV